MNKAKLSLINHRILSEECIHLDKNENPFALPPSPREELRQILSDVPLNRYPDPESQGLKRALSNYCGASPDNIVVGNGGDELLYLLFMAFVAKGGRALTLEPTFSEYYHLFELFDVDQKRICLREGAGGFSIDEEELLDALAMFSPQLTLIDSPNNPTGMTLPGDYIEEVIQLAPGVTLIDEAYAEFSQTSILDRFQGRDLPRGTVVLRTLSKAWGLAGLRIGYAVCDPWTRKILEKVRPPYNINSLSQIAAQTVLGYRDWMESRVFSLRYIRDNFVEQVNRLSGWKAFGSGSNFVLLKGPESCGADCAGFRERGVEVKAIDWPALGHCCFRVSIGKEEEMTALLRLLQEFQEPEEKSLGQVREA